MRGLPGTCTLLRMAEERTGPYRTKSGNSSRSRISVDEAARALGVTVDAIRKRVQRGTIPHERDESGRVWVLLEAARTMQDTSSTVQDTGQDGTGHLRRELLEAKDETITELRDRVASLERQMEAEREARRRADTIIARLTEANAALAERPRELEAPEEPLEASETEAESYPSVSERPMGDVRGVEDQDEREEPQTATQEPEGTARRPWWVRILGG